MSASKRRTVPMFVRPGPRGVSVAGVEARPGAGPGEWLVAAATLGGAVPRPGDRLRGTDGAWLTVAAVGPPADGAYPCTCTTDPE